MSNIEPTEEQKQAANAFMLKTRIAEEDSFASAGLARLLAEREAKLQARIDELTERSARRLDDSTAIDALVYAIACLELQPGSERDRAVRDALNRVINHVGAIEVRARDSATKVVGTLVAGAKAREDALTARVAELEVHANTAMDNRDAHKAYAIELEEREAQHLADIKAGRKAVAAWLDDPWLQGRRKLGEDFMAATAHYDDAKADAPECNASCGGCDVCALASDVCCKCGEYDAVANQDDDMTRWMCSRCYAKAAEGGEG